MHHVHQVALRFHHRVDVLVGRGRLVDHVLVLAALDAFGRSAVVSQREAALGYFDPRELPTVIRILGPSASKLSERMAEVVRLEREMDAQDSRARQQAFS